MSSRSASRNAAELGPRSKKGTRSGDGAGGAIVITKRLEREFVAFHGPEGQETRACGRLRGAPPPATGRSASRARSILDEPQSRGFLGRQYRRLACGESAGASRRAGRRVTSSSRTCSSR